MLNYNLKEYINSRASTQQSIFLFCVVSFVVVVVVVVVGIVEGTEADGRNEGLSQKNVLMYGMVRRIIGHKRRRCVTCSVPTAKTEEKEEPFLLSTSVVSFSSIDLVVVVDVVVVDGVLLSSLPSRLRCWCCPLEDARSAPHSFPTERAIILPVV